MILMYMSICYLRSPQEARAVSAVMNRGALPAHVLSPSKGNQTISKSNLKRKRTSGKSGSSVSVRPAPPSVPKQDTTLILVELSDWVSNRLKVPCGARFGSGDPCSGNIYCIFYHSLFMFTHRLLMFCTRCSRLHAYVCVRVHVAFSCVGVHGGASVRRSRGYLSS